MGLNWTGFRQEFCRGGRGWILLAVAVGWFFAYGLRVSFPVLLPYISVEFGLDLATGGALMTLLFLTYAFGQLPGGILGDRFGEQIVLTGGMFCLLLGIAMITFSGSFLFFSAGIILSGFGAGAFAPLRFTILSDLYTDREKTAHGVTLAVGDIGTTVLPIVMGALAATFFWRLGVGFALPLLVVLVVVLWWVVPPTTAETTGRDELTVGGIRKTLTKLVRRPVLLVAGLLCLMSSLLIGYAGMYPTYLVAEKGITEQGASVMMGVFFACAITIHLIAGTSADRIGGKPVIVVLLAVGTIAFSATPFVETSLGIVVVTMFSSAPIGVITIALPYLIDVLGDEGRGMGLGLIRTVYISIASLSPGVIGILGSIGYFDATFALLCGVTITSIALSWKLPARE